MDWDFSIPVVAIVAWAAIVLFGMHQTSKRRELVHRERLAMIERGLIPPPDKDPEQFERVMGSLRQLDSFHGYNRSGRARAAGVMMICIGAGVTFLIWMASDEPRVAFGVGGMVAMIGLALFINAMLDSSPPPQYPSAPAAPPPNEPR